MKRQKIKNKNKYITEPIYIIASYYCNRNYSLYKRNSKRAFSSAIVLSNYSYNISKKQTKKGVK